MRALAISAACLILCQPAEAFVHAVGGHGGGFEGGAFHYGVGYGFRHRGFGFGWGGGYWGPAAEPVVVAPRVETPSAVPVVVTVPFPLPLLPAPGKALAQAPQRPSGPHIIYIGTPPQAPSPRVIYGTQ